jgi:hypothetical protein
MTRECIICGKDFETKQEVWEHLDYCEKVLRESRSLDRRTPRY